MSTKKRTLNLTDSDDSDSASDSELLNIARKATKPASSDSSDSDRRSKSQSPPPKKRKVANGATSSSPPLAPTTQLRPGSDSDTSDSDSDWGANTKMKKKKKPLPKTRKTRISHSGSDSEPEEGELSDSDEDEIPGSNAGGSARSGSEDDEEEEEFDDGLDENLIGDEGDRVRLEKMTEKEREQELFNRIEKREVLQTRFDIEKKLRLAKRQEQRKKKDKDPDAKTKDKDKDRNSSGSAILPSDRKSTLAEKKAGRIEKFAALKAKRDLSKKIVEEKEKKEAEDVKEDDSDSDTSEKITKKKLNASQVFSSDDDSDHSSSKSSPKRRSRSRSGSRSGSNSDSDSKSSGSGSGSSSASGGSDIRTDRNKTVASKHDLERIRLSRHKMERFVHLPIFSKAIIGCFVRVGIGNNFGTPVYRAAEIVEVCETAKVYPLGTTKTNKGLRLRHGKQERVFRLEFISNKVFSDSEYDRWVESCANHDVPLPTLEDLSKKEKDIKDLLNYQYTNDDIDTIVTERLRFTNRPTNYAVAKTELLKKRDILKQTGDDEEILLVNEKIAELDTASTRLDRRRTSTISSILYINERNRKFNVVKAEKAIMDEVRALKGVRAKDPFTRRQTRPTIVTKDHRSSDLTAEDKLQLDAQQKIKEDKQNRKKEEDIQRKKHEEDRAREDERKRIQEEDLYAAHNFDLNIDFGHTISASTPSSTTVRSNGALSNSSSTPRRSINLEEYKKKKGLL